MPFTSLCDIAHSYYSKREFSQSKILFCPSLFYKAEFYKDKKNRHEPHYNILRLDKILFRSLLLQIIILDKQPPKKSVKLKIQEEGRVLSSELEIVMGTKCQVGIYENMPCLSVIN